MIWLSAAVTETPVTAEALAIGVTGADAADGVPPAFPVTEVIAATVMVYVVPFVRPVIKYEADAEGVIATTGEPVVGVATTR